MYPTYTGTKTALAADDIAGIRSIYSAGAARSADVLQLHQLHLRHGRQPERQIDPTTLNGLVPNLDIGRADRRTTTPSTCRRGQPVR